MRGRAGKFAALEPPFRRKKYEGEDENAQHVVLPRRAPVRPENDFFEDAPEHKKVTLDKCRVISVEKGWHPLVTYHSTLTAPALYLYTRGGGNDLAVAHL